MNVSEAIRFKRAVRQYKDQQLPQEAVIAILNAGRRSQSSKNSQPWHFIAIQERSRLKALSKLGTYADHISGAGFAVAIITPPPEQRYSIMFDAGQAAAYMQLAAWELGVGSCLATIYQPDEARHLLGFPDDLHLRIAISFGYPLDDENIFSAPRAGGRKSLEDIVHWEQW